jgi:PleD family two-component response regulator
VGLGKPEYFKKGHRILQQTPLIGQKIRIRTKQMNYKNILHVDDDAEDCDLFREALLAVSDANYTAINHPIKALKELEAHHILPDVIVVDLNMPIIDGMEFLAEVRRMVHLQNIPVIIFSTSSRPDCERKAMKNGASDYLVKPHNFNNLKKLLLLKF